MGVRDAEIKIDWGIGALNQLSHGRAPRLLAGCEPALLK